MLVGDKITYLRPYFGVVVTGFREPERYTGTVVYIHPERRFFTVEFKFANGKFRQSYFFPAKAAGDYSRKDSKK